MAETNSKNTDEQVNNPNKPINTNTSNTKPKPTYTIPDTFNWVVGDSQQSGDTTKNIKK